MILSKYFSRSPVFPRVWPFVLFVLLTSAQGAIGPASAFWIYFGKTLVGIWLILEMRPFVAEMRWAFSLEAVFVGVAVFVVWVGISGEWTTQNSLWLKLGLTHAPAVSPPAWNPEAQFGPAFGAFFIAVRILGSTFVVPPLEEVFYRSFLYRYVASPNFTEVPLNKFLVLPLVAVALVFGLAHNEWLAAIFCALAYQWLVIRKNRLGDSMTAHAITNCLLGIWVVWRHQWNFW